MARRAVAFTRRLRVQPDVTESLLPWCEERGLPWVTLSPALRYERRLPRALLDAPHPNFAAHRTAAVGERFLVCVPEGRLWGRNGLVVLPDGTFSAESIYGRSHLELDPAFSTRLPAQAVDLPGDHVTLLGEFSNTANYYHWIHDGLLRLHGVAAHLPPGTKYLVPAGLHPHQRETLHMLGISDEQLVPLRDGVLWRAERLWFPAMPPSGAELPAAVEWLRDTLATAAHIAPHAVPGRRYYLSRAATRHARVTDEAELVPVLERFGFEVVLPETLTVTEQATLFSDAEAIVSGTSAALANCLFASADTKVLEVLEPEWAEAKAYVIWTLADVLGQEYSYVVGDTVANPSDPERADVALGPDRLERALATWLG